MDKQLQDIDKLFQENLLNDAVTPPAEVWQAVQNGISTKAAGSMAAKSVLVKWLAGGVIGIVSIGTGIYLYNANKAEVATTKDKQTLAVENKSSINNTDENSTVQHDARHARIDGKRNPEGKVEKGNPSENNNSGDPNNSLNGTADNNAVSGKGMPTNSTINLPNPVKEPSKENRSNPGNPGSGKTCAHLTMLNYKARGQNKYLFMPNNFSQINCWVVNGKRQYKQDFIFELDLTGNFGKNVVRAVGQNLDGCNDSSEVTLQLNCPIASQIFTSNTFTPNGDGINDEYYIMDGETMQLPKFSFIIYNAALKPVYTSKNPGEKWNGKWNGRLCEPGAYPAVINFECEGRTVTYRNTIYIK